MPTFSTTNHALQFGNNSPTVSIYGTDTDGYIVYDMSTSGTFYQFAPNTKYLAGQFIFDNPFVSTPGIVLTPANPITAALATANPAIEFFIDQGSTDAATSYFKISAISSSTPQLGAEVLIWTYAVTGSQIGVSPGTVTSIATDSTLTGGPISTTGTLGINLANANTWSAKQTFTGHIAVDGYTLDLSGGAGSNYVLQYNGTSFAPAAKTMFIGELISTSTSGSVLFASSSSTLAQDNANFNYNSSTHTLTIGGTLVVDGYTISPANATSGQALVYNGSAYVPQTVSGGGGSSKLQDIYNNGANNSDEGVLYDSTRGGIIFHDASSPISSVLFGVWNPGGSVQYLTVLGTGSSSSYPGIRVYQHINAFNGNTLYIGDEGGQTTAVSIGNTNYPTSGSVIPVTINGKSTVGGPRVVPIGFPLNSVLGTPSIAGAINFNPGDYAVTTIKFRAVFSNGNNAVSTSVTLHDATNNVDIYTTTYSGSTAYQTQEQTLSVGSAGTNQIANSAAIYEVRIQVNNPVTGGTNFIQLYSAEFRLS